MIAFTVVAVLAGLAVMAVLWKPIFGSWEDHFGQQL